VNLASRLESLNWTFRTEILIGENTSRLVEQNPSIARGPSE
jgi:class 3 adenylate cyclase